MIFAFLSRRSQVSQHGNVINYYKKKIQQLISKTPTHQEIYEEFWASVTNRLRQLRLVITPKSVMTDFERAAMNVSLVIRDVCDKK